MSDPYLFFFKLSKGGAEVRPDTSQVLTKEGGGGQRLVTAKQGGRNRWQTLHLFSKKKEEDTVYVQYIFFSLYL